MNNTENENEKGQNNEMINYSGRDSDKPGEYSDYTLPLALFDAVPVILFLVSGMIIYSRFDSRLFLLSVLAVFAGGAAKVVWKIIVTVKKRDVAALNTAFRILMPGGFALMILSVISGAGIGAVSGLVRGFTSMPSMIFFIAGIAGMCLMGFLGSRMDQSAKSNWIEETVNAAAQTAFLAGLLLL